MANDHNKICNKAWGLIILGTDVNPGLYSRFDAHCLNNAVNPENFTPSKQCTWEQSGDKFILDNKGKKKELPEDKVVTCLASLALAEKWLVKDLAAVKLPDPPKAAGLADDATPTAAKIADAKPAVAKPVDAKPAAVKSADAPKAVGLAADATPTDVKPADAPKAAELPSDATPSDAKPVDAPNAVGLGADATPTTAKPAAAPKAAEPNMLTLRNRLSAMAGVFFNITPTGLSVNGNEPRIPYIIGGSVWGRAGALITPATMSEHWAYTTFVGVQAEGMSFDAKQTAAPYNNKFNVWGVGPAVSGQFVYEPTKDSARLIFGPDFAFLVGALSTKGLIDVGIPDRLYEAPKPRAVGTALAGLSVGMETPAMKGGPSATILLGTGLRWFFHGDQVTDTPAGYEGAMVRLKSGPTFDFVKLSIGLNY